MEKETLLQQQLAAQGVTIPPGLRPVFVEGTPADIRRAVARYGIPSNVQLFGNHTDASKLGLPAIDSFAMQRSRLMKRSAATSPAAAPAGASTAAASAPPANLATTARDDATSTFKADVVADKNMAGQAQREMAPQRFRVLLFVKP